MLLRPPATAMVVSAREGEHIGVEHEGTRTIDLRQDELRERVETVAPDAARLGGHGRRESKQREELHD